MPAGRRGGEQSRGHKFPPVFPSYMQTHSGIERKKEKKPKATYTSTIFFAGEEKQKNVLAMGVDHAINSSTKTA